MVGETFEISLSEMVKIVMYKKKYEKKIWGVVSKDSPTFPGFPES